MPDEIQLGGNGLENYSSQGGGMLTKLLAAFLVGLIFIGLGYIGFRSLYKPVVPISKTANNQENAAQENNEVVDQSKTGEQVTSDTDIPQTALNKVPELEKKELETYLKKYYYDSLPQNIRTAHNLTIDNIAIRITRFMPGFARGTTALQLPDGVPSAVWWLAKVDGSWKVIEATQEPPSCSLMTQYKFPQEIYESCLEK